MRAVRVGTAKYVIGPLQCPRCGRLDETHLESFGLLRVSCQGKRCRASWTAVRLPPGSRGALLLDLYGEAVTRAVLSVFHPDDDPMSQDAMREAPLVPVGSPAVYMQQAPDEPEPMCGWRRAETILHALLGKAS